LLQGTYHPNQAINVNTAIDNDAPSVPAHHLHAASQSRAAADL
jgi:hypothetical protein